MRFVLRPQPKYRSHDTSRMTTTVPPLAPTVQNLDEPERPTGGDSASSVARDIDVERVVAVDRTEVEILAAELSAGRLAPPDAIHRLIEEVAHDLPAGSSAELRTLLWELCDADPHLAALRACFDCER